MKYGNFIMKVVCLAVILCVFWRYQTVAVSRAAEVAENEAAVAEVEAYNEEVKQAMNGASETASGYVDGVYEGEGTGFGGAINVSVTIEDGKMTKIDVLSASGEDPAYYEQAESVLDEMIRAQSADVDTVSGATFSSGGLIEATGNALEKAVK